MAHHCDAFRVSSSHGLDNGAIGERRGQVAKFGVHAHHDDAAVLSKQIEAGAAFGNLSALSIYDDVDVSHPMSLSSGKHDAAEGKGHNHDKHDPIGRLRAGGSRPGSGLR